MVAWWLGKGSLSPRHSAGQEIGLPSAGSPPCQPVRAAADGVPPAPVLHCLQGREDAEGRVMAAEKAYSDLQWRLFELVTAGAAERQRRALRSLLFNLTTQRQLLRQVEQQEALRLRMRDVEQRIASLLAEEQQQPAAAAAQAAAPPPRGQDWAEPPAAAVQRRTALPPRLMGRTAAEGSPGELRLLAAGASIPHDDKVATGGEDAFFLSSYGLGAFGVADGVGGWALEGIDPALYPRRLMAACEEFLQEQRQRQQPGAAAAAAAGAEAEEWDGPFPALTVLEGGYRRTEEPGSTTAILAVLAPGGLLSVAHLGDCELKVVRQGAVTFATEVRAGRQGGPASSAHTDAPHHHPPPHTRAHTCTPTHPHLHLAAGAGAPVEHASAAQLRLLLRLRQPPRRC